MNLKRINAFFLRSPPRIVLLSFSITILLGSFLLRLPHAKVEPGSLSFCNALFTSTSATCVTGLIVVDTGTCFTIFGQIVILALIQIGGLGIMTISTFFMYLISGRLNIFEREVLFETISQNPMKNLRRLLVTVFAYTAIFESLGACLLFLRFIDFFPVKKAIYLSVFHSISAFCNAGFSLFSDSFISHQSDPVINVVICVLIVLGGLGFVVVYDITSNRRNSLRMFWSKLSLHSRLVLLVTAVLIFSGAMLFFLLEQNNILADSSMSDGVLISLFQSITTRTAGFNSVNIGSLTHSSLLMLIILMFVGASPGSCGGGIKTSTFFLFLASMRARFLMHDDVNLFGRRIPKATISKVTAILFFSLFVIILFTFILLVIELPDISHHAAKGAFMPYLFEVVSAYGTVGLSMGVTTGLQNLSKFVIIILMIIGRLGPLTLAIALKSRKDPQYRYIEENVLVG